MKITALLAMLALGAVASAATVDPAVQFMEFAQKFKKRYHNEEEWKHRFEIFRSNLEIVEKLNSEHGSTVYGVTKFMDLAPEEFKNTYLLRHELPVLPEEGLGNTVHPTYNAELVGSIPTSFDWRDKGAVTPVKNQGQCGSCWAFSTTEEIESQWILAGNTEAILSEQQIVDCDKTDDGCGGGDTPTAYAYVISAGGLESEASYPYKARNQHCQFDKSKIVASITGWKYITKSPQSNETLMLESLVTAGPFSICVDAASWQFYTSGIIQSRCGQALDHCVQLTGYNQGGSVPYWIVRNSWGTDWGLSGYLYVEIGKNLCGIADEVTIAVV